MQAMAAAQGNDMREKKVSRFNVQLFLIGSSVLLIDVLLPEANIILLF